MNKKFLIFLLTLFFFANLFSQNITVQKICEGLAKNPNTIGDFTQIKTINKNGRQLKSSGRFIISPFGIMWDTIKPYPSKMVVTKDSMIQIGSNGKKTVHSGSDIKMFESIATSLSAVFTGDGKTLEENFFIELSSDDTDNKDDTSNATWTLVLKPKDSTIATVMQQMEMKGSAIANEDGVDNTITMNSIEIFEGTNKLKYELENHEYPKELTQDERENFFDK